MTLKCGNNRTQGTQSSNILDCPGHTGTIAQLHTHTQKEGYISLWTKLISKLWNETLTFLRMPKEQAFKSYNPESMLGISIYCLFNLRASQNNLSSQQPAGRGTILFPFHLGGARPSFPKVILVEPLQDGQWGQPCAPAALCQVQFIISVLTEEMTWEKRRISQQVQKEGKPLP